MDNVIYNLQETDIRKDSLARDALSKEASLVTISRNIEESRSQIESVKAENNKFMVELSKVEGNLDDLTSKKDHADSNILNVTSAKQLDALKAQIEKLTISIDEHEASILSMYEEQETAEKKLLDLRGSLVALEAASKDDIAGIEVDMRQIAEEREELFCRRAELLTAIDVELGEKYENLYTRHGDQVVYDTEDMVCPGCGMALSRRLFNKMESHRDEFFDCNSCGRLLRYVGV